MNPIRDSVSALRRRRKCTLQGDVGAHSPRPIVRLPGYCPFALPSDDVQDSTY